MAANDLKAFLEQQIPFTSVLFARGHSVFAPVLTWEWVTLPTEEEMKSQLAAAKQAGFGTVYVLPMPAEFRPHTMVTELEGYLGERFFRAVKRAVETARSLGLRVWLYDEGGWPSGSACGRVTAALPTVCEKRLQREENGAVSVRENPGRADIYSRRASEYFTEITHHAYAAALGEAAENVDAIFTDEPAGAPNAVSPEILAAFSERYGCDLRDCFPEILFSEELTVEARRMRGNYFALLESLFCETMGVYRSAAARCGWLLTGHLDRDHTADAGFRKGYGNFLAALRTFDIPGVDVIEGQIRSEGNRMDGEALPFYPRFASSAALQKGTPLALSESFAVYGNALTGDEMRYVVNYQLVRGINLFNFMQMPSTVEKWYAFSERPIFHPAVPGFFASDGLFKEIERACLFMATGLHCADVALLYPSEELLGTEEERERAYKAFLAAGETLEQSGADFDLIDLPTLCSGIAENGSLRCGAAKYAEIIVPDGCFVSADIKEKIDSLSRSSQPLVKTGGAGFLHRVVRDAAGDLHICVFNQNRTAGETSVTVDTQKRLCLADPRTGTFSPFRNGGAVRLFSGQCALLFATDKAVSFGSSPADTDLQALALLPLSAEKTAEFRLSETGASLDTVAEPLRFAADYTAQTGAEFSGEITLRYRFISDGEQDLLLRAERLFHFAEIFVNGSRAGSFCAAPYDLRIGRELTVKGNNTLTVKLCNLPAAAFAAADAGRFFAPERLGPYHLRTLEFEKEAGGFGIEKLSLFGISPTEKEPV